MKLTNRKADWPIEPLILHRWSPRWMSAEPLALADLQTLFEAARWAPSSGNLQPWRFVYVLRDSPQWALWMDILSPGNRPWAGRAGALLALVSRRQVIDKKTGGIKTVTSHSLDAGAAWTCLALQAASQGLVAHAMGGFDRERASATLGLDDRYHMEIVIALGRPGDPAQMPDDWREREQPNGRRPQADWVFADTFRPDLD